MDQQVTRKPLDQIIDCVEQGDNFVLQGGAGSGKTETLKQVVQTLTQSHPNKKFVCITHTNKAADEITDRIGNLHKVSTIHSFLNSELSPFKKSIHKVISEIFCQPPFEREPFADGSDEKEYKKSEHKRYKDSYEKLQDKSKQYFGNELEKVTGKREYEKDPESFNGALNEEIEKFNDAVRAEVLEKNYKDIGYNETPYDSFRSGTYGHDGLLKVVSLVFKKFSIFGRLLSDKYDCIFIDEYQDTDREILLSLLTRTPTDGSLVVGLFGDSEQSIYEDGIGSAQDFVDSRYLTLIEKADNFRCSPQVIRLANKFRSDGLEQEVALKKLDGVEELPEVREGSAKLFYCIKPLKNDDEETAEYKECCTSMLDQLIEYAAAKLDHPVQLKLPNRAVAADAGFPSLYKVFNDRFAQPREEIKKHLDRLQFSQLFELLKSFEASKTNRREFNRLLAKLKLQGYSITNRADKARISSKLTEISESSMGAYATLLSAIDSDLIKKSDAHERYMDRRDLEVKRISEDPILVEFERLFLSGFNTAPKIEGELKKTPSDLIEIDIVREKFDEWKRDIQKKNFFNALLGDEVEFNEIMAFYRYEDDDSDYMTMHKTKGTGLDNVLVVLDEYNWNAYDFGSCFSENDANPKRQLASKRLIYVACSRTKKNLAVVRLAENQEDANRMISFFEDSEKVNLAGE